MPEFEKIGKVLDVKVRELAENGKKIFSDGTAVQLSKLDQMATEQNNFYTQLGKKVYEDEKTVEQSKYREFIEEIKKLQSLIDAETLKEQGRKCPKCGALLSEGAIFCSGCGEKVEEIQESVSVKCCPQCGVPIKEGAKFCVKCGKRLNE